VRPLRLFRIDFPCSSFFSVTKNLQRTSTFEVLRDLERVVFSNQIKWTGSQRKRDFLSGIFRKESTHRILFKRTKSTTSSRSWQHVRMRMLIYCQLHGAQPWEELEQELRRPSSSHSSTRRQVLLSKKFIPHAAILSSRPKPTKALFPRSQALEISRFVTIKILFALREFVGTFRRMMGKSGQYSSLRNILLGTWRGS
jgi:hypothetical protein